MVFDGDVELRTAGDTRSNLAVAHTLCTKFTDLIAVCDFAECEQRGVQRERRVDFEIFGIFQKFCLLVRRRLQIIRESVGEFRGLFEKESCFEYGFTVSVLGRIDKVVEMLRRSEEELQSGVFFAAIESALAVIEIYGCASYVGHVELYGKFGILDDVGGLFVHCTQIFKVP